MSYLKRNIMVGEEYSVETRDKLIFASGGEA